jgi:queuine tRNA-ribosyltransferase
MATMRRHVVDDTFAAFYRDAREALSRGDDAHPSAPPVRRRRRDTVAPGDRFAIRESEHGWASVVDTASGEIMHAGLDPGAEAQALYVEQSRLPERLREPVTAPLVVWDVGLGAGHNAVAALRCCEAAATEARRPLHLLSFEHDTASFRLARRHPRRFPHLQGPAAGRLLRVGEWRSERPACTWTLVDGDFRARMADVPVPDVIFYDPFSLRTDRALWTLACFAQVFAACADHDTELFTYSAATPVRAALLVAGFLVARGAPTGTKQETTLAMTPAAARRATARGRVLLGPEWLERWRRSDAKFPSDVDEARHALFAERMLGLPQLRSAGA